MMQVICDRYPAIIDTKGGARNFLAKKIWITSNEEPANWWPRVGLGAMTRRLEGDHGKITHMTQPWAPPGEVPAPLPLVVPPMFGDPAVAAVIVPMLQQMQRHSEEEAAEAAEYERLRLEEEAEGERQFRAWMAQWD